MNEYVQARDGGTRVRCERATREKSFDPIRETKLIETSAEALFRVLQNGTVSTNIYPRRFHNFALDLNWLPYPVIPKSRWPPPAALSERPSQEGPLCGSLARRATACSPR